MTKPPWPRNEESEMRILVALLVVLAVLYYWDVKLQQRHALGWPNPHGTVYASSHGALAAGRTK